MVTYGDYFDRRHDVVIARAPGRLDVMGGIADYSGSLVLELPLAAATVVAAQRTEDAHITVRSSSERGEVRVPLLSLLPGDYDDARALLTSDPTRRWAAYVLGALVVLRRERMVELTRGMRLFIDSTVPAGKGVASSAAIEVAAMLAICALYDIDMDGRELAVLCQKVENLVVGAPCGVMDQMTAACGEENRLLALLCQPAEITGQVPIPDGLELYGIDSGIRHEIGGADYGAVRTGAFMGLRILSEFRGTDSLHWNGYLANITPEEWRGRLRAQVPLQMKGGAFLDRYGYIADTVTRVDPAITYAVRQPTEHPILEHARVSEFRRILEGGTGSQSDRARLGKLMGESHASYSACGLGSSGTDRLVALVREAGSDSGLYGAKITGGGSGGVVAVLSRKGSLAAINDVAQRYAAESGVGGHVLGGSSPGGVASGHTWHHAELPHA